MAWRLGNARPPQKEDAPLLSALPVVLYNGDSPWSAARNATELIAPYSAALLPYQMSQRYVLLDERHSKADDAQALTQAVMLLEQSRSPGDLALPARLLTRLLAAPGQAELRRAFTDWLWVLYSRLQRKGEQAPPPNLTLEEMSVTLEERVARWPDRWIRQGVEQGLRQGLDQQRALLRHLAEVRFGTPTADQLSASLRDVQDPRQFDAIGEAIVRSKTGDELLRQTNT